MEESDIQMNLLGDEEVSPASEWDENSKKRALDELFTGAKTYTESKKYLELLRFLQQFKRYSPYNGMLVHIQKPGAKYVLRASDWREKYGRTIRPSAQPLVALQPMGPVMFLFDVSDTEGVPLPPEIETPFEPYDGSVRAELELTLENCKRDGIRIHRVRHGSQRAGSIQRAKDQKSLSSANKVKFRKEYLPISYELLLNDSMSREAQYGTLVHELGHLYCGHLGTVNPKWWPDRRGLSIEVREFEAESVSYLVCKRLGIETPSSQYLNGYLESNDQVPNVSLERIVVVSGLIEQMGKKLVRARKKEA